MLRRGWDGVTGVTGKGGMRRRTDRKSHNQKHEKTKAKGDGKRRKRENIVKKMATMFISPYLWLGFHNKLSITLTTKPDQL